MAVSRSFHVARIEVVITCSVFWATTGFSVTYHVQQELMREAQRLLYYSKRSVKEIANIQGFDDEKYFNRLFRKVIGISPGAFKKKNQSTFIYS